MEAVRPYTTRVMPSLKTVKNMLEESFLEHGHVTLNTTVYCVTKQQIEEVYSWTDDNLVT